MRFGTYLGRSMFGGVPLIVAQRVVASVGFSAGRGANHGAYLGAVYFGGQPLPAIVNPGFGQPTLRRPVTAQPLATRK